MLLLHMDIGCIFRPRREELEEKLELGKYAVLSLKLKELNSLTFKQSSAPGRTDMLFFYLLPAFIKNGTRRWGREVQRLQM